MYACELFSTLKQCRQENPCRQLNIAQAVQTKINKKRWVPNIGQHLVWFSSPSWARTSDKVVDRLLTKILTNHPVFAKGDQGDQGILCIYNQTSKKLID